MPVHYRSLLANASILVVGLALSWLAVRNAAIREWGETDPAFAAAFLPAGATPLAAMAQNGFLAAGGRADAETRRFANAAFRAAPAGAPPLILAGLAASARGDTHRALRLMRLARARDPSEATARYWLLDHHIRSGNYDDGLEEIGPALRLRPEAGSAIFALVAGLYDVPGADGAVSRALGRDPDWRAAFFSQQAVSGGRPMRLLRMLRGVPPAHDPAAAAAEQRSVLYAAVQSGAYDEAYAAWRGWLPARAKPIRGAVYDPAFRSLPGTEPFNWTIRTSGEVGASYADAGPAGRTGLSVRSNGTARTIVAEQHVPTSGGRVLSVDVGAGSGPRGAVMARIACARDDATLVELPLRAGSGSRRTTAPFTVPNACGAVRVEIVALPTDVPVQSELRITGVRIDPA